MTEKQKRASKITKPYRYFVSLTEGQNALLRDLQAEDVVVDDSLSSYFARLLVEIRNRREEARNAPLRGVGRPRKPTAPEDDPNRTRTIPNPYTQEHALINEYELAVAESMREKK